MLGKEMVLDIYESALFVDPLECVTSVAVIVTPSIRGTVVAEEHHACMVSFWRTCKQVEERVIVEEEVLWRSALRADDIWALDGVSAEENRPVESSQFG